MPQYKYKFTHPDLPAALRKAFADHASGVPEEEQEARIEAAKASDGVAFIGFVGAKDRETAKDFLLRTAERRYAAYLTTDPDSDYADRVAIDPDEMTLSLSEVKQNG